MLLFYTIFFHNLLQCVCSYSRVEQAALLGLPVLVVANVSSFQPSDYPMLTDALVNEVVAAVASAWERKWEQTAGTEVVDSVDAGSAAVRAGAGGAWDRKWERVSGTDDVDGTDREGANHRHNTAAGHAEITATIDATGPRAIV
jgi:hypothetical protein